MTNTISSERLVKILNATAGQQEDIDAILSGKPPIVAAHSGPLLLGMTKAADFLGVSRTTLWRMCQSGRLTRVEILPGSFLVRRSELEAIAKGCAPEGVAAQQEGVAR